MAHNLFQLLIAMIRQTSECKPKWSLAETRIDAKDRIVTIQTLDKKFLPHFFSKMSLKYALISPLSHKIKIILLKS